MRLIGGVRQARDFYDCQWPHEVGNFILSTMFLYRYSMDLHEMEANGEFRFTPCPGRHTEKSPADSWRTGAALLRAASLKAAWLENH